MSHAEARRTCRATRPRARRGRADAPETCLLRATIEQESPLKLSAPVRVLDGDAYDRHAIVPLPEGRGFAFIDTPDRTPEDEHLHVVLNWGDAIRRRLAP